MYCNIDYRRTGKRYLTCSLSLHDVKNIQEAKETMKKFCKSSGWECCSDENFVIETDEAGFSFTDDDIQKAIDTGFVRSF